MYGAASFMGERERQENSAFLAAVLGGEGLVRGWCIVLRANYTPVTELKMRGIGGLVNGCLAKLFTNRSP